MFKILIGLNSWYLSKMFTHSASFHDYGLRSSRMNRALPQSRSDFYRNSLAFTGAKIWNDMPIILKEESQLERFMGKLDHCYQHQQNQFQNIKLLMVNRCLILCTYGFYVNQVLTCIFQFEKMPYLNKGFHPFIQMPTSELSNAYSSECLQASY